MKRLMFLLFAAMLLASCSNDKAEVPIDKEVEVKEPVNEVITEVVSEQQHDIVLFDNEDLKMTLLNSKHERFENANTKDKIELSLELENKKNRTFEFLIKELKLDGVETNDMRTSFDDNKIGPNETKKVVLTTHTETNLDDFDLNFNEHLSGTILFSDHERSRIDTSFSEYIIEQ